MAHYTIDELIARWKREELTVEQIIGQMLLAMKELEERIRALRHGDDDGAANGISRGPSKR